MKPLFIPLRRIYFDAFAEGAKRTEYRLHGARWNERTCIAGRPVILSCGYSGARLSARLLRLRVVPAHSVPGIFDVYPECSPDTQVAALDIERD